MAVGVGTHTLTMRAWMQTVALRSELVALVASTSDSLSDGSTGV